MTERASAGEVCLSVRELNVVLGHGMQANRVLEDVPFEVPTGTTVGLVGESGSASRHSHARWSASIVLSPAISCSRADPSCVRTVASVLRFVAASS